MQIRSDLASISLNKIGFTNTEGLKLLKGEIVSAVVEKGIGEDIYQVNIKGMTVEAAAELPLMPGQNLLLRSEGSVEGRQVLRIIKPGEEYSLKVASLLQEMGYRADERLTALAAKLIQYGLPISRENIDRVLTSTRWLGGFNPSNLETATWALASGIKTNPEILNALRTFLTQPGAINQLIEQALQSLPVAHQLPDEGLTSLRTFMPLLQTDTLLANPVPGGTESSGTLSRLEGGTGNASLLPSQNLIVVEELLRATQSLIRIRDTGDPAMIRQDLQRYLESNQDIIKALSLIQEVLARFTDSTRPVGTELLHLVRMVSEEIIGQAAFNSVDQQASNHSPGYYYLAIPVMVDGRDRVMELRIHKDERGNRPLDELEEIRIAVSLDTANLGLVLFHVAWHKDNQLIIQGVVEKKGPKEVIERNFGILEQRLIEGGFRVQFLGIKVTAEPARLRPGLQTKEPGLPILGIDITV